MESGKVNAGGMPLELIRLMIREPLERVIKGGSCDWETSVIAGVIRAEVIEVRFKVRLRREGGRFGARG